MWADRLLSGRSRVLASSGFQELPAFLGSCTPPILTPEAQHLPTSL